MWLDEIERSLDEQTDTDGDPVTVNCGDVKRLIAEARRVERVREWLAQRNLWHMDHWGSYTICGSELEAILEDPAP